jgi:SAM-dependent methyltransferase
VTGDLDDVVGHYESSREEDRLVGGVNELELLRTQEILRRHLPPAPARVLDVGGATGVHAAWLLEDGYDVHLVDLAPRHVAEALARLGGRGLTAEVGDARALPASDGSWDVALLLGPLYHLVEREDRLAALREVRRAVRPGGIVAAAGISRFASLHDGLARGFLFDPVFRAIVSRDLSDGRHENPDGRPHWFTTAFFHRPGDLRDELVESGLTVLDLVGVEGLAGWLDNLDDHWADLDGRAAILDAARQVESEPSLLGVSAHLLAVARRSETS